MDALSTVVGREWDIALTRGGSSGRSIQAIIPAVIAGVMNDREYTRAKLRITPEGILLIPYVGGSSRTRPGETTDLPHWDKDRP